MELEVRPASEVERFVAFARASARRIALELITSFSADNTRADVRVIRYD